MADIQPSPPGSTPKESPQDNIQPNTKSKKKQMSGSKTEIIINPTKKDCQETSIMRFLDYSKLHERGDYWHPDPEQDKKLGGPGANARAREDRAAASKPKEDPKKLRPGESYMDYHKRRSGAKNEEFVSEAKKKLMAKVAVKPEKLGYKVADIGPDGKEHNVKTYGAYKEEFEGETLSFFNFIEARAEDKRGLEPTGENRKKQKTGVTTASGQVVHPTTSYSGGQNSHTRGKGGGSKEQRRSSSRRYVDQPGGVYAKPENKQGEGRYADKQSRKRPDLGSRFD